MSINDFVKKHRLPYSITRKNKDKRLADAVKIYFPWKGQEEIQTQLTELLLASSIPYSLIVEKERFYYYVTPHIYI